MLANPSAPLRRSISASWMLLALAGGVHSQSTSRVSVDSSGAQANDYSGWTRSSISADGRFVAFDSFASNLVPGDTNGTGDVFVRDLLNGTTERVSVDWGGAQGDGSSYSPSISADGRYVAFASESTNFVVGATNGWTRIFVRDRQNGTTECASVGPTGVPASLDCEDPAISADGNFVAFDSFSSDLVLGDANGMWDVFVRDRVSSITERVSVDSAGMEGNGNSYAPSLSGDGHYVAFASTATNLVPADMNSSADVLVRDRVLGTTQLASVDSSGTHANDNSYEPSMSSDGRYVAFKSYASNIVVGDTNGYQDVFVHDLQTGTTEIVSIANGGAQGNFSSYTPSISTDGRYVAFRSGASNFASTDTNAFDDVFVHDRLLGTTERLSLGSGATQGDSWSGDPSISADGRYVSFVSNASNLVSGDTNSVEDILVRDRGNGDCNANGIQDVQDILSGTSADCNGNWIPDECDLAQGGIDCDSNGLIDSCEIATTPSLDLDNNGVLDRCQVAGTPYCFGDGTGHTCPCDPGQIGSPGHGCANSSGEGAILSATGAVSVTGDSLQLHIANMPSSASVLFFQGTLQQNGGQGSFNGDGLLCANGTSGGLIRLGVHGAQPGTSSFGAGISGDPLISVRGAIPTVGGTRYYQAWYRDNTAFCTTAAYNFSNGVAIVWAP